MGATNGSSSPSRVFFNKRVKKTMAKSKKGDGIEASIEWLERVENQTGLAIGDIPRDILIEYLSYLYRRGYELAQDIDIQKEVSIYDFYK